MECAARGSCVLDFCAQEDGLILTMLCLSVWAQDIMAMASLSQIFAMGDDGDKKMTVDEFVTCNMNATATLSDSGFEKQANAWLELAKAKKVAG